MNGLRFLIAPAAIFSLIHYSEAAPDVAASPSAATRHGSWIVYWDSEKCAQAFEEHGKALDEISVFAYHFSEDGRLVPPNPWVSQTLQQLHSQKEQGNQAPQVLVTFVNDVASKKQSLLKDPGCVHRAIGTPRARSRHIQEILSLSSGADGVEIDYEKVSLKDRRSFSLFIKALAQALHERGQTLSVVVEPKVQDVLKNGAGAIDWPAVARHADRVKIMAYFYSHGQSPPGPLAPTDWVVKIAQWAQKSIPPEKLSIALTVAGIDWPATDRGKAITYAKAMELSAAHRALPMRDQASQTQNFQYTDESGISHDVWFEDSKSLEDKRRALAALGVKRVDFWYLGQGDPALWNGLSGKQARAPR